VRLGDADSWPARRVGAATSASAVVASAPPARASADLCTLEGRLPTAISAPPEVYQPG
jgi:hypothetical protein